jgi:hypothetical protein
MVWVCPEGHIFHTCIGFKQIFILCPECNRTYHISRFAERVCRSQNPYCIYANSGCYKDWFDHKENCQHRKKIPTDFLCLASLKDISIPSTETLSKENSYQERVRL